MKSQLEWIQERYPHIKGLPVADSLTVDYLVYAVAELSARVEALEPKPRAMIHNPLICHCEEFVGENFECEQCGGMKF